jgi:hypothetical protein
MNKGYCPYTGERMRGFVCKKDPCVNCPLDRNMITITGKKLLFISHPED